jgi:rod shape-determining protein MreB
VLSYVNLDKLLSKEVGLPMIIAEDAESCVIRGMGKALAFLDIAAYDSLFLH